MSQAQRVVVATANAGKLREFQDLLGDDWLLVAQGELGIDSVEETGDSFLANALLKARHAAAASGLPAIADDSGLEVEALNGAPGIYSARYAGADGDDHANNEKLLAALDGLPADRRLARYRCVIVLVTRPEDPEPLIAEGSWEGRIADTPRGSGGFGYDPLFLDPESGLRAAELSPADKHARSHRGKAIRRLRKQLSGLP